MKVRCIDKEFDLTVGKIYEVLMLENQGDFYRLLNDSGIEEKYPSISFAIVETQKAKCLKAIGIDLVAGKIYDVVSVDEAKQMCRVVDDSGEDYVCDIGVFEFL